MSLSTRLCHTPCSIAPSLGRRSLLLGAAACAMGWADPVRATAWPSKPLQLIVPWPAGGATDLTMRLLQYEPSKRLSAAEALVHPYFTGAVLPSPADVDASDVA